MNDVSAFRADPKFTMQCFVTSEPIAAKKAGLDVQTFLVAEAGYNPYTTVLVTRGDYRQKNPKVVQSMIAAVRASAAMDSASKNAGELIDTLTLNMNRIRQAAIRLAEPFLDLSGEDIRARLIEL